MSPDRFHIRQSFSARQAPKSLLPACLLAIALTLATSAQQVSPDAKAKPPTPPQAPARPGAPPKNPCPPAQPGKTPAPAPPSAAEIAAITAKIQQSGGPLLPEECDMFVSELVANALILKAANPDPKDIWPDRMFELAAILNPNHIVLRNAQAPFAQGKLLDGLVAKYSPETLGSLLEERGRKLFLSSDAKDRELATRFAQVALRLSRTPSARQFDRLTQALPSPVKWKR